MRRSRLVAVGACIAFAALTVGASAFAAPSTDETLFVDADRISRKLGLTACT